MHIAEEEETIEVPWALFEGQNLQDELIASWVKSSMTEKKVRALVKERVLPPKELIEWRPAADEVIPTPNTGEVVVFASFFERGLSLPAHPFLRGLLHFYGLELQHVTPNGLLQVACFITLCECFLGIEPHFALWQRLFTAKANPSQAKPALVGGAGFQLRPGASKDYVTLPLRSSNKGWHSEWFYRSEEHTV